MGWAKYAEDNREIFDSRMFDKGGMNTPFKDIDRSRESSLALLKNAQVSLENEYLLILMELSKISDWLDLINIIEKLLQTQILEELLKKQKEYLLKDKEYFLNYVYDKKYKGLKDKYANYSKVKEKNYITRLMTNYLSYIINCIKENKNKTDHEAILLNSLIMDLEDLANKYYDISKKDTQIPLVRYIRESILKEENLTYVLCRRCKEKTFSDFRHCIYCKYTQEG